MENTKSIPQNPRKALPVQAISMSTSILIPKDIVTVRHLNQKGFKCELYDYLKTSQIKLFKKIAEKCDSDSKDYMVSQDLGSKQTTIGTGSSFEILWNEKIIMSSKWG